jgi:hypothetical protein
LAAPDFKIGSSPRLSHSFHEVTPVGQRSVLALLGLDAAAGKHCLKSHTDAVGAKGEGDQRVVGQIDQRRDASSVVAPSIVIKPTLPLGGARALGLAVSGGQR